MKIELDAEKVLARANEIYKTAKVRKGYHRDDVPPIQSDQVKAICMALTEAINSAEVK